MEWLAFIPVAIMFFILWAVISGAAPMNYNDPLDDSNVPDEYKDL